MLEGSTRRFRLRRWLLAGITVVILAVVLGIASWHQTPETPPLGLRPQTVVPGIYLLGGLAPAGAYVVETTDGLVLVDTGLRAELVKWEMMALGLNWRRVRVILLTHVHADHSGGARELRAATGAKVYAGRGDAAVLRSGRPRAAFCSTFAMPETEVVPVPVDVELDDEQSFTVGDVRFTALGTPGHTPGSICYLMERGAQRVLFSGDVIISLQGDDRSASRMARPLGTYTAYLSPHYRGDAAAFLSTLRRLRAMPAPQLVLPGHPRNDPTPQSPVMTQQRWQALLDPGIRDMEHLLARYRRDGVAFLDGKPKKLLTDLYYLGNFHEIAVYGFFVETKFFLVNAPGGAGLNAFVESALHKLGRAPASPTAVLLTSADAPASAGLAEMIHKHHPRIVAPLVLWQTIEKMSADEVKLLTPEQLPQQKWFSVRPIALRGRGAAPLAYLMPHDGKTLLFTGSMPIEHTQKAIGLLTQDFESGRGKAADYRSSLAALADCQPDFWLPACAEDSQNARLDSEAWRRIRAENERLFH